MFKKERIITALWAIALTVTAIYLLRSFYPGLL